MEKCTNQGCWCRSAEFAHPATFMAAAALAAEGNRVKYVPPDVGPGEGHTDGTFRVSPVLNSSVRVTSCILCGIGFMPDDVKITGPNGLSHGLGQCPAAVAGSPAQRETFHKELARTKILLKEWEKTKDYSVVFCQAAGCFAQQTDGHGYCGFHSIAISTAATPQPLPTKCFTCGHKMVAHEGALCTHEPCACRQFQFAPMPSVAAPQPLPTKNERPAIADLVKADIDSRVEMGEKKYGTKLQPHNGRDALMDAYQEAIDLTKYLRQMLFERDGK